MQRVWILTVALLVITWNGAGVGGTPGDAEENFNQALKLGAQGDFPGARQALEQTLKLDPFHPPAIVGLGTLQDLKANKIKPETAVHVFKAMGHGSQSQWREYLEEINLALKLDPRYAAAYNHRANAYTELDLFELALADYEAALTLDPRDAVTYLNRGVTYRRSGDLESAISDYNRALTLNPDFAAVYYMRGVAYGMKGEMDRAVSDFDRALTLHPRFAEAHFNKAMACEQAGRLDQATAAYLGFLKSAAPEQVRQIRLARERVKALENLTAQAAATAR
jgi:tetratricopeptide (TPR) repeat protein